MVSKTFAALALMAALSAPAQASEIYDNACVRRHMQMMLPAAACDGDAARLSELDEAWSAGATGHGDIDQPILRAWAEVLLQRAVLPTAGLRTAVIRQDGCRNGGLFAVHTEQGSYIAKRSTRMFEPVRWATLQMHLHCYDRASDLRDRNREALWFAGDDLRQARIMPLVAWDYSPAPADNAQLPAVLPNMLFAHAYGTPLDVPDPERLDVYTAAERDVFVRRAYALGVSLALLQMPALQGSSRAHVFDRATWMHDDLHLSNMFFDDALERIELIDCIEMRRSSGWDKDLRGLVLHRSVYPVEHPLRQAWSQALAEGYLSRTTGVLYQELRNAFASTLIYTKADFHDPRKLERIW